MKPASSDIHCSECDHPVDRRRFIATATGAVMATSTLPSLSVRALAAPTPKSPAETAVRRLFDTLTDEQKKIVALPWSDKRRTKISANWTVTSAKVGTFQASQQEIIHDIVRGITSEDGYERFIQQMKDDRGGIGNYAVAIFGNPEEKQFEFELTGRHLTLRADGDTTPGVAFGGPIVYGHGKSGNAKANLFWYQTEQVNEVFKMLDGKQRKQALLGKPPSESAVRLRKAGDPRPGIAGSDLSTDQKEQLAKSIEAVMKPYRKEDVDEAMEIVKASGGLDKVHVAFYSAKDIGGDGVWDVWRIEGPTFVCHFRGAPHVHAYINVARRS